MRSTVMTTVAIAAVMVALLGMTAPGADTAESARTPPAPEGLAVATFAGGCFWCVEAAFEKVPGVKEAVSGYSGGEILNPTYRQVSAGGTGHTEAVRVYYDPAAITYEGLLAALWRMMDPTDAKGQFVDRGSQYRPAVFYHDEAQRKAAEASIAALDASGRYGKPLAMEVVPAGAFYVAEEYHQDYYKKNPLRYQLYTHNSGRYQFIERVWGKDQKVDFARYRPGS
jgi:peptide methionine sulfoxide reductase msrA/msrB